MHRTLFAARGFVTYLAHEPTVADVAVVTFIHRTLAAWRAHVDRP